VPAAGRNHLGLRFRAGSATAVADPQCMMQRSQGSVGRADVAFANRTDIDRVRARSLIGRLYAARPYPPPPGVTISTSSSGCISSLRATLTGLPLIS